MRRRHGPIPQIVEHDPQCPFTLWFETLPSGDTARLVIWPRAEPVYVVLYWNQKLHSERTFRTVQVAESWGYELHRQFELDALAGALLGYDQAVLARLQARCSVT